MRRLLIFVVGVMGTVGLIAPAAANDGASAHPNNLGDVIVHGLDTVSGGPPDVADGSESDGSETYTSYDDSACGTNELLVETYQQSGVDQPWQLASSGCGAAATAGPVVTPDLVLEAVKTVGLPVSSFEAPAKTLVQYETTVYTETTTFARIVTVVGYEVDVRAQPSHFTWHFGDGEVRTTTGPGAPYPSDEITHAWRDAHRTFRPSVDTIYAVSYRVDDGPWLDIAETLMVPGPESRVRINEATPILS